MAASIPKISLTDKEKTLRQLLLDVADYIATKDGYQRPQLRFTGGWVRDKLLGTTSKDIDISVSSMTGYSFGCLLKEFLDDPGRKEKYGQNVLGGLAKIEANPEKSKQLETTTTKILGLDIDLVNLRKETYSDNSRNPSMEFGTPEDDALRRDATVNALFYNLLEDTVEDYTKRGLNDLQLKIIRTPLSPYQTFKDDPLRVLRCIRFASKLDYEIDTEAKQCMSESSIQESLRAKISRERIGIEVEKMLKGNSPHKALSLIDSIGLYEVIFTNPNKPGVLSLGTARWDRVYNQLLSINTSTRTNSLHFLRTILIPDTESLYFAWLLCSLVPWSRIQFSNSSANKIKPLLPAAALVAREGLKTDNKATSIVKNAVLHLDEIITSKDSIIDQSRHITMSMKWRPTLTSREGLGMSVRRWGANWQKSAIFAMLVQVFETEDLEAIDRVCEDYACWLLRLQELELLDAPAIKPIVDGKQIMRAVGMSGGPWLATAIDTAMEWQLRNPHNTAPDGAIAAVLEKLGDDRTT